MARRCYMMMMTMKMITRASDTEYRMMMTFSMMTVFVTREMSLR